MLSNTLARFRVAARAQSGLVHSGQRFSSTSSSTLADASTSTATTSSTTPSARTTHYRVTLRRSAIGLPENIKLVLQSLGLRKRLQSVFHPHHPKFAGMILAVKELVHVDNVRRLDGGVKKAAEAMAERIRTAGRDGDEVHAIPPLIVRNEHAVWVNENGEVVDWGGRPSRKAPRGYTVVGNLVNEERNREIQAERMTK